MQFWESFLQIIQSISGVVVPSPPVSTCLSSGSGGRAGPSTTAAQTLLAFFYARKSITLTWQKPTPPTVAFWEQLVNSTLLLYKDTYCNRGCKKKKMEKVWSPWLCLWQKLFLLGVLDNCPLVSEIYPKKTLTTPPCHAEFLAMHKVCMFPCTNYLF